MRPVSQRLQGGICWQARVSPEFTESEGCEKDEAGKAAASSSAQLKSIVDNVGSFPHYLQAVWR